MRYAMDIYSQEIAEETHYSEEEARMLLQLGMGMEFFERDLRGIASFLESCDWTGEVSVEQLAEELECEEEQLLSLWMQYLTVCYGTDVAAFAEMLRSGFLWNDQGQLFL